MPRTHEADRKRQQARRAQLQAEGRCIRCAEPRTGYSLWLCPGCLKLQREYVRERIGAQSVRVP